MRWKLVQPRYNDQTMIFHDRGIRFVYNTNSFVPKRSEYNYGIVTVRISSISPARRPYCRLWQTFEVMGDYMRIGFYFLSFCIICHDIPKDKPEMADNQTIDSMRAKPLMPVVLTFHTREHLLFPTRSPTTIEYQAYRTEHKDRRFPVTWFWNVFAVARYHYRIIVVNIGYMRGFL